MTASAQNSACPLLNRDFTPPADGYYQIVPLGEWPITVRGSKTLTQVCDAEAIAAMLSAFNRDAQAAGERFAGVLVDYDHFSSDTEKPSEAAGWIVALQNRADGLYARIRWSDEGQRAVEGGRYRFLSPVWNRSDVAPAGSGRVRPLRLDRAAVTNDPNMKGIRPLTNRAETGAEAEGRNATMDYRKQLLNMLGLPEDAEDEAIQNACAAMDEQKKKDEEETAELENRAKAAEARAAELDAWKTGRERLDLEAAVDADLAEFAPVIQNRDEVKALLLENRAGTRKLLASLKKPAAGAAPALPAEPLRNREQAQAPQPPVDDETRLANRRAAQQKIIGEVQAELRCATRAEAYEVAERRQPNLFA